MSTSHVLTYNFFFHLEVSGYWIVRVSFSFECLLLHNFLQILAPFVRSRLLFILPIPQQRMHQYKTVAQILLVLSIFNLALAAPVVREIYDARDNVDMAVPTAVVDVAVMSKEQYQSRSDGPPPDGSTTSPSSPPPPPPPPPDASGSTASHSSPQLPDGPPPLYTSSPPDREASLHELPTHPDEPTTLPVSPLPAEIAPAAGQPVPVPWPSTPGGNAASASRQRLRNRWELERAVDRALMERAGPWLKKVGVGLAIIGGTYGAVEFFRHRNQHRRTIDPDRYVSNRTPPTSPADA